MSGNKENHLLDSNKTAIVFARGAHYVFMWFSFIPMADFTTLFMIYVFASLLLIQNFLPSSFNIRYTYNFQFIAERHFKSPESRFCFFLLKNLEIKFYYFLEYEIDWFEDSYYIVTRLVGIRYYFDLILCRDGAFELVCTLIQIILAVA